MNPFSQMMQNGGYEALMGENPPNFDASQAAFLQQNQPQNPANLSHPNMAHKVEFTVSLR